jgi:hypothetical protein
LVIGQEIVKIKLNKMAYRTEEIKITSKDIQVMMLATLIANGQGTTRATASN